MIGVIADTPNRGLQWSAMPMLELPSTLSWRNDAWVILRAQGNASSYIPVMQRTLIKMAPGVSFYWVNTLDTALDEDLAPQRFTLSLLGVFAIIGTTLLVLELYGLMSYNVARRSYELGLRTALGATSTRLIRVITSRGLLLVLIGVVASLGLSQLLRSQLGATSPFDLRAYCAAGVLMIPTALAAIFIPGISALRISPAETLRHE